MEFIRLVTINAQNSKDDILSFFNILERFVSENYDKLIDNEPVDAG
jgi:hypothetical protein